MGGKELHIRFDRRRPRLARRGLTLIELMMAMTVLAIALVGYARTVAMASVASSTAHEANLANEAARKMIETLRSQPFAQVFCLYNAYAGDDPGPGAAPGANFAVAGLEARKNDADGMPGEILFPTLTVGGVPQVRENVVNSKLGTPCDLTGDGVIDALNHSANYQELPVLVRVRWRGVGGPGQVEFQTVLGGY
jgi:prepilin-type N-terminal cleavage/methylation domain-containing protein